MTNILIKELVPSFRISEKNLSIELLLQGDGFSDLEGQHIDIRIESEGGVRWGVDSMLSRTIKLEGKTFFVINAHPVRESFQEGGRVYTDLKITLKTNGHIITTQTFKVLYSDPIIG